MDNTTIIPGQAVQDDGTATSGDSNALVIVIVFAALALPACLVVSIIVYHRHRMTSAQSRLHSETKDIRELSEQETAEQGEVSGSLVPLPTDSGSLAPLPTDSGECQAATSLESRLLDSEETWRRAKFFFPGLLNNTTLKDVEAKYMRRRFAKPNSLIAAIQVELKENLDDKIRDLKKKAVWEYLNKKENAANFCIAVGMNDAAVHLRFELIENLEKELPFPTRIMHILHSIQHLINTIHVNNPFGHEGDIDGQVRAFGYRGKNWLSYLGVRWPKSQIVETVGEVQAKIEECVPSRNGFFVHGTSGTGLEKIMIDDGEFILSGDSSLSHDFGPGFYCFKDKIPWALSFAVDRCWPVQRHPENENVAIIKSSNPSIVVFPKPDHTIFSNERDVALEIRGKPMDDKALEQLQKLRSMAGTRTYDEFVDCRKQWKNDKDLGYWKDFVKLSLIYKVIPPAAKGYVVYYGPMHSDVEQDKPTGDKIPVVHEPELTQYCFRNIDPLGTELIFLEFDVDWNEWVEQESDYDETKRQVEVAQEEIVNQVGGME